MDANSFITHIKTDDIYKDTARDVKTRFHTSNYEIDRLLPKRKNNKFVELMKDELGGQIMRKFVGLRTYSYLKDNGDEYKNSKGTEKCVIKRKLKSEDYKN